MRKILPLLMALVLLATTAPAAQAGCIARSPLTNTYTVALYMPSGNPGSTWFQGVEGNVEIRTPGVTSGWTRYGIAMTYDWDVPKYIGHANLTYYIYPNGTMQLRAFATDSFGSVVRDYWYNRSWVSGSVQHLEIKIIANGSIYFYENGDFITNVQPIWTWKANEVYAQASISNRANFAPGTLANHQNWSALRYNTQYGEAAFASGSTYYVNDNTSWFGTAEPSGGTFEIWDKYC